MRQILPLILTLSLYVNNIFAGNIANSVSNTSEIGSTREINIQSIQSASNNAIQNSYFADPSTDPPMTPAEQEVHGLAAFIKEQNRLVDRIDSSAVMDLPVGISSTNGVLDYTIIVKSLVITPDSGAFLEVCMSFEIPQNGRKIAFIGKHIPFSFSGGIKGDARIELEGNQPIDIGESIKLILKDSSTYVTFDCFGFKQMVIDSDVEFSTQVFVPEKSDGTPDAGKPLKTSFTTTLYDWNDLIVELTIPAFQVKGLTGVGFYIKKATFDFSDLHNSPGIVFPKNYESSYFSGDNMTLNLWRGFYLQEALIKLPKEFKRKDSTSRITFFARNLIIDENGLSGAMGVDDLLDLGNGDMDSWSFSIDSLYLDFVANQLTRGGFNGQMNIPVFKDNSLLNYSAIVSTGGNYNFTVSCEKPLDMDIWAARLVLQPTSTITIAVIDGKFLPKADLTGTLSITKSTESSADGKSSNDLMAVAGITFEHLVIRTQKPFISVEALSFGAGSQNKAGNFPITINNIGLKSEGSRTGINFNVVVNFMNSSDEGFGGNGGFIIWGKRDSISKRWKYDGVEVTELAVDVSKGDAFELHGKVNFFRGDSTYGKGFRGELDAKFGGIGLKAIALFGSVNTLRYWYADAMVNLDKGIPIGTFSIYGFGGGAYHHMRQQGFNEKKGSALGATRSGIIYVPTDQVALGIKASVALGTTKKEVINGDATFEISFNNSGGINQIGFEGNVYFITSNYTTGMSDVTKNAKELSNGKDKPDKTSDADRAQIWGNMRLLFDNANHVFHGEITVYANVAGGVVRGVNSGNMAGKAIIHFGPNEWYIHIGSPTTPIGLEIARILKTKAYFMVGHNIPGSPPPPAKVSQILGNVDLDYMRDLNELGNGKGIAFGASLEINTGDITFLIFYARLEAGVGFDIMLKDYGDAYCEGRNEPIGINGWFANGQAYAYVEGSVGIKVNLLFYSGRYEILKVGVAAVLQAKGPNPFWMRGIVGGQFRILGGLVKGDCKFEFTIGDECKLVRSSPLSGIEMISEITPSAGSTDVNVFNTPQALFNMPVNEEFEIKDENGVYRYFRIKLDYFKLILPDKSVIPATMVWNNSSDVVGYSALDVFPSQKEITASVQVSFEEKVNGAWKVVMFKGQKVVETKENKFTSGNAPDYIPLSNIEYTYPVMNQFNFYKNEYGQGYIKLKRGQPELFTAPAGFTQKGRMKASTGLALFDVSYSNSIVKFNIPQGLSNTTVYDFDIVNIPANTGLAVDRNVCAQVADLDKNNAASAELTTKKATGSIETLQEKSILSYYFRTSMHNTFTEKLNSMEVSTGWRRPIRINVHELGVTLHGAEMFDKMETHWNAQIVPVVQFAVALQETDWYNNTIYPLLYEGYPLIKEADISWRDVNIIGVPPVRSAYIRQYPNDRIVTEEDITGVSSYGTPDAGAFVYNAAHFIDQDFYDIRTKLANYYAGKPITSYKAKKIIESMFPGIQQGNYPVDVKYVLPGINQVTTTRRIVINNPIPDA